MDSWQVRLVRLVVGFVLVLVIIKVVKGDAARACHRGSTACRERRRKPNQYCTRRHRNRRRKPNQCYNRRERRRHRKPKQGSHVPTLAPDTSRHPKSSLEALRGRAGPPAIPRQLKVTHASHSANSPRGYQRKGARGYRRKARAKVNCQLVHTCLHRAHTRYCPGHASTSSPPQVPKSSAHTQKTPGNVTGLGGLPPRKHRPVRRTADAGSPAQTEMDLSARKLRQAAPKANHACLLVWCLVAMSGALPAARVQKCPAGCTGPGGDCNACPVGTYKTGTAPRHA